MVQLEVGRVGILSFSLEDRLAFFSLITETLLLACIFIAFDKFVF